MTESSSSPEEIRRIRVGYALEAKKVKSFLKPCLVDLADERGLDLVPIDVTKPLSQQGPFHCILHKLYKQDWTKQLHDFSLQNPNLIIIDPPSAIEKLHDRVSMLRVVTDLPKIGIPKQVLVDDSDSLSDPPPNAVIKDLKFPLLAKPLVVDGSSKSHKMSLVFSTDGLKNLETPVVLQQFVNHGGVIFKVYVAGQHVKCVKRRSLPDLSEELGIKLSQKSGGLLSFSQISNLAVDEEEEGMKGSGSDEWGAVVEMPAMSFVSEIANGLRKGLGLNLFNFDMIRDRDGLVGEDHYVIDINYFPGYEKLPCYETLFTDFLWDILHQAAPNTISF